jgi:3-phenylpropionate/trans-cinnamate dioxygenase ferredoxin reductase subunit
MVVAGVGVTLNLELAQAAGLEVDPKDGVIVDEFLQTSHPDIFAAGDIACFPDLVLGRRWHVEHHLNAKWQGQTAGKVMAGQREPYRRVPYFFSDELDLHMILRGDPQSGKNAMMTGDVEGAEFVELYSDDSGRLTMGIAVSRDEKKLDDLSDTLERLILAGVNLKGREADLQQPGFDVNSLG